MVAMPEDRKDMDLEERKRQLEERRRILERRRKELGHRKHDEKRMTKESPEPPPRREPERPKRPVTRPPITPPIAPKAPPVRKEPIVTRTIERKPVTPAIEVPEKPTPPPPKKEAGIVKAPPLRPARAGAPRKSTMPLVIGLGAVVVIIIVVIVFIVGNSGKAERRAAEAAALAARADSLARTRVETARRDSLHGELEQQCDDAIARLETKVDEAQGLQAAAWSPNDFQQAKAHLDQAIDAREQGLSEQAKTSAAAGLERIAAAITTSQRIQRREDQARANRDQALSLLQANVSELEESLAVLSGDGAVQYAGRLFHRLQSAVTSAREQADAGNIEEGNTQAEQGFELIGQTRAGLLDGKRQEAEARALLRIKEQKEREDSIRAAEEKLAQERLQATRAELVKLQPPPYPRMAEQAGIEGVVTVEFEVAADGTSRDFKIIGNGLLGGCNEAAIEAIKKSDFKPATQGGRPVATRMRLSISFKK